MSSSLFDKVLNLIFDIAQEVLGIGEDILEPMSMTAIGQVLNMSRDRVRTLEHKALRELRTHSDQVSEYL